VVIAATGEGSHSTPAVPAGKGKAQQSAPAGSSGKGKGRHSAPSVPAGKGEVARHHVQSDGPISSKRKALLADRDTPAVFAGMEEGDDNDWYESIIREAAIRELEEDPELHGLLPVQYFTPRSETPEAVTTAAAAAVEEGDEISMPKFFKKWGLHPSDLDPDEAGPSTRRPRVLPVSDDDLPTFDCGICFDTHPLLDMFRGLPCDHKFCLGCMAAYVEGKVGEADVPISCPHPECKKDDVVAGVLHPEECKKSIDFAAFSSWGLRLAEGAVPHYRRAYCPNRRCAVLLETSGEDKPAMAECPACKLALCAACGMEWRAEDNGEHMDCAKGPDAAMMKKLADEHRWKKCPKCKMMVERVSGCRVMNCRCRMVFCYDCGLQMSATLEGAEKCSCV
uniref:RBR-type E3 ubiquitin transferase n=2 Tax=Oryza brachyantha TaxID=4533 RepID=J3MXR9_ORYBR